jgi:nucleoside-diphosphate-sugar epimerase
MFGAQNRLHVVLGATGGIGRAVVDELILQGIPVRAINFSGKQGSLPKTVDLYAADCTDYRQLESVCQGASVIYNCLNVEYKDWFDFFPQITKNLISLTKRTRVKLVVADNLYMYGENSVMPLSESSPMLSKDRKGQLRMGMSNLYTEAMSEGSKITLGRGGDYFGPWAENSSLGSTLFKQALTNKTINLLGNIETKHSFIYIKDFARALVTLGLNDSANGQIFHLPSDTQITTKEFVELTKNIAQSQSKLSVINKTGARILSLFVPVLKEVIKIWYQFDHPFYTDYSKFQKYFPGVKTTPHSQAIAETLDWYRQKYNL